ncbi:MAG: Dipeptide transport system permease protein DppB, partial [uncultured Acetobacteraceae bacterium]
GPARRATPAARGAGAVRRAAARLPADAGGADRPGHGARRPDRHARGHRRHPHRPRPGPAAVGAVRTLPVAARARRPGRVHHQQRRGDARAGRDGRPDLGADAGQPVLVHPARHPARHAGGLLARLGLRPGGDGLRRRLRHRTGVLPRAAADLVRGLQVAALALHRSRRTALDARRAEGGRAAGAGARRHPHRPGGAHDAHRRARRAGRRPRADRAREGLGRTGGGASPRVAQRLDSRGDADRPPDRLPARRRGGDGDRVLLARRGAAGGRRHPVLRLPDGAGHDPGAQPRLHPGEPFRGHDLRGPRPAGARRV